MDDVHADKTPDTEKQEMLQRMARRKGRKLKGRANSKKAIRTWAEYSGVNLEPTGSYSKYTRWLLLIISIGLFPAMYWVFAGQGASIYDEASVFDVIAGYGLVGVVIVAGIVAGMIVVYTFLRAIIETNRR